MKGNAGKCCVALLTMEKISDWKRDKNEPASGANPGRGRFSIFPALDKAKARGGHHSAIMKSLGGASSDVPHFRRTKTMWSKPHENRCCC
jgi:hypothetical protein